MPVSSRKSPPPNTAPNGHEQFPIAAVAYYGPTADLATKVVVAIINHERHILHQHQWLSVGGDVRYDESISHALAEYIAVQQVKKVVIAEKLVGCPHEAGIDYPAGEKCPYCPYWSATTAE
jgi:hypothetical protein